MLRRVESPEKSPGFEPLRGPLFLPEVATGRRLFGRPRMGVRN